MVLPISYMGGKCQCEFLSVYTDVGQLHTQFGVLALQLYNFVANTVLLTKWTTSNVADQDSSLQLIIIFEANWH